MTMPGKKSGKKSEELRGQGQEHVNGGGKWKIVVRGSGMRVHAGGKGRKTGQDRR